jgi:hypothetical protein
VTVPSLPASRRVVVATWITWVGSALLGVALIVLGVLAAVTGSGGPSVILAFLGVLFGAVTIFGAVLLRRHDPRGVRLASVVLRFALVVAGGNLAYSVVNGLGDNLAHALWSLLATVLCAVMIAALEQLRTALSHP